MQVGELFAKIGLDTKDFDRGLKQAGQNFSKFAKNIDSQSKKLGEGLKSVGKNMTKFMTLPLAGAGAMMIKTGMDFEAGMSNIKALGGETGESMKQLHDLALEMGAKTKYSALEAAQGIEELKKAGVTTEQVLNGGLKGALSLAAAGEIEVAQAAEIASTVLNAYKDDNLSVARAADVLAGAANASATDVSGLSMGLSQASAVASGMGMTFEDTATALAVFAGRGLKGSDAGTSLKTMLMNLQPTTKQQIALFERLNLVSEEGTSLFYDEKGQMKSLADIAGLLQNRLKDMTDAERAMALEMMFGSDAIRAGNILYKEGEAGIRSMNKAMNEVTADQVAEEKMNNLKGSIENMTGSVETLMVKMYETQSGPLKGLVDGITALINVFSNLPSAAQGLIVIGGAGLAALGPMAWMLGQVITTGKMVSPVFKPIGSVLKAVFGGALKGIMEFGKMMFSVGKLLTKGFAGALRMLPVLFKVVASGFRLLLANPIGILITALIVAAYLIYKNWDKISKQLAETWTWLKEKAGKIWGGIKKFFSKWGLDIIGILLGPIGIIAVAIYKNWDKIKAKSIQIWTDIKNWFSTFFDGLKTSFSTKFEAIKQTVARIWEAVKSKTWEIWEGIKTSIANAVAAIGRTISGLLDRLDQLKLKAEGARKGITYTFNGSGSTAHWATGTNFHPGGLAVVGENGPELVNLPRGVQVFNNRDSMGIMGQSLTISGTVRVEGVNNMNQLVGVAEVVAKQIEQGDRRLAGRVRVMPSMA